MLRPDKTVASSRNASTRSSSRGGSSRGDAGEEIVPLPLLPTSLLYAEPTTSSSADNDDDDAYVHQHLHQLPQRLQSAGVHVSGLNDSQQLAASQQFSGQVLPITIPHGFQLIRSLLHANNTIRSVLHTPSVANYDAFVSLDTQSVHCWNGQARVRKLPLAADAYEKEKNTSLNEGGSGQAGLVGILRWLWVKKYRIFVVATNHLQLKVLDYRLLELSCTSSIKPVLSLEYNEYMDEIIAGGVGNIRIWKLVRKSESVLNHTIFTIQGPRLTKEDLNDNQWITCTMLHATTDRLFVACESTVMLYDYETGKRLDIMRDIHELSITFMEMYDPMEYLITAGRDGHIKVWNIHRCLVVAFQEHTAAITGLALPCAPKHQLVQQQHMHESTIDIRKKSRLRYQMYPPILMSASMDGSIRLWNLDTCTCVYRLETQQEILGMDMMRKDQFYHYSRKCIYVWNLNRYQSTFFSTRSPVTHIKRFTNGVSIARIGVVTEDGAIRLVSSVSATCLMMAYPTFKEVYIVDIFYNLKCDILYALMNNGDIVLHNTLTNPCTVITVWECNSSSMYEFSRCNCLVSVDLNATAEKYKFTQLFWLFGGSDAGQIVNLHTQTGKYKVLTQAHPASIVSAVVDTHAMKMYTGGEDKTVRVWALSYTAIRLSSDLEDEDAQDAIVEVSHLLTIPMAGPNVPLRLCINYDLESMCIASSSGIVSIHNVLCSPDALKGHMQDEEHTMPVTKVAYLGVFNIYASSSMDGTIKIWSPGSALLREIQFGEPVTTFCFCNERGDLLVGLQDQVGFVRWQDYMSPAQLKIGDTRIFRDDLLELPRPFDSSNDFWAAFQTHKGFNNAEWGTRMHDSEADSMMDSSDLLMSLDNQMSFNAHGGRRKAIHQLLNSTPTPPMHASLEVLAMNNLINTRNLLRDNLLIPVLEKEGMSLNEFDITPSQLQDLLLEMERQQFMFHGDGQNLGNSNLWALLSMYAKDDKLKAALEYRIFRNKTYTNTDKYQPEVAPEEIAAVEHPEEAAEEYRNEHKINQIEIKMRDIKAKIKLLGTLPNLLPNTISTIRSAKGVAGGRNKEKSATGKKKAGAVVIHRDPNVARKVRRRLVIAKKKPDENANMNGDADKIKADGEALLKKMMGSLDLDGNTGSMDDMNDAAFLSPLQPTIEIIPPEEPSPKVHVPRQKRPSPIRPPPQSQGTTEPSESNKEEPLPPLSIVVQKSTSLEPKTTSAKPSKNKAKPSKNKSASKNLLKSTDSKVASSSVPVRSLSPDQPSSSTQPAAANPPTKKSRSSHPKPLSTIPPKIQSPPIAAPIRVQKTSDPMAAQRKVEAKLVWALMSKRHVNKPSASHVSPLKAGKIAIIRRSSAQEPSAQVRKVSISIADPHQRLAKVMALPWFPGLAEGQPLNVNSVIVVLITLLRDDPIWQTRVEAAKALLYLYRTFQHDILDPMESIISAQLEILVSDDAWEVRAQVAANLSRYGVYHNDIVFALISRLADEHVAVRRQAMHSLTAFGITTRATLRTAMIRLGLVRGNEMSTNNSTHNKSTSSQQGTRYRSILDDLYDQYLLHRHQTQQHSTVVVRGWMNTANYTYVPSDNDTVPWFSAVAESQESTAKSRSEVSLRP